MTHRLGFSSLLALSLLGFAACAAQAPDPTGIYQITALTHNAAACAPGGDSILGGDTFAVVAPTSVLGIKLLTVLSCASEADCRAKAAALAAGAGVQIEFSYTVQATETDGAFSGEGASSGFDDGTGTCELGDVHVTTLTVTGGTLDLAQRITVAPAYPAAAGNVCSTAAAQAAAAGASCSQLDHLTAELVAPL